MATIDGKQIVNTLYQAGVETVLTVGYAEIARKLLRRPHPTLILTWVMLICCL